MYEARPRPAKTTQLEKRQKQIRDIGIQNKKGDKNWEGPTSVGP